MATLGDLKTRILQETVRDDLADDLSGALDNAILKSIEDFEWERWWFNESLTTLVCTPGSLVLPFPATGRRIDLLRILIGGVRYTMTQRALDWVEDAYSVPQYGQPTDYAYLGDEIRLWPTPNAAYPVQAELVGAVQPPLVISDDASANLWTNEGADLIVARTKKRLYRDYLSATVQDTRVVNAQAQEDEAYTRLRSQSNRRTATERIAPGW